MNTINVVVMSQSADPRGLDIIRAVDPRVRVTQQNYLEPMSRRIIRRAGRGAELPDWPMSDEVRAALKEADVILCSDLPSNIPALAPRLRWVQRLGAGVDHFGPGGGTGIWESDIVLTTTGFHAKAIAEFVMNAILAKVKRTRDFMRSQDSMKWERHGGDFLWDKTVGIIGLGRIGSATARLARAFNMRVLASRRTPTGALPPNVDQLFGPDGLHAMLGQSDFVVLALPLVAGMERCIGEKEFAAMKRTGMFINVARGLLVDEPALARALQNGTIAFAAVDAWTEEPLPLDNPFWKLPNVFITPHASAAIGSFGLEGAKEFAENLRRYIDGQPLVSVVDRTKGY